MRAAVPATTDARGVAAGRDAASGWLLAGLAILGAAGFLFADGLAYVAGQWSDPEHSHGWLIPAVTGFVLWSRREALLVARRPGGAWLGAALVAAALAMLVLSRMAFVLRGPYLAFVVLLLGLGLAALGWRAMRLALVPLLFLLFAFPLPGSVAVPLSTTLQLISSKLGAGMLHLLGVSIFLDGNIIDLDAYKLQVAEACSGLRYLFPLASFGFLCAWLLNAPLWGRAFVLLSTVPVTIATNSARIALTGVLVEHGGVALAEGFMHLFEGWVIFLVALAVLFAEMWAIAALAGRGRRLVDLLDFDRIAGVRSAAGGVARPPLPVLAGRVPAPLVACAGLMLATALAYGPLTEREQMIPARPGLVTFPLRLEGWAGRPMVVDGAELKAVGASDYLLADFTRGADPTPVNLWVAYYGQQLAGAAIHSPKDCLPGGGWEYVTLETVPAPVPGPDGSAFAVNRGVIAKGLDRMVIWYWLEMRGRRLTNDTALKLYNLWDSYRLGRSDGALVRLMTPVVPGEVTEAADARLKDFLARAYPPLAPHVGL